MEYSANIYGLYLKYISADDIYVYSIDEAFFDVTQYLRFYNKNAKELAQMLIDEVYQKTGIPVFAIPNDKLDATGIVKDQLIQSRDAFNEQFTTIANNITALLS